MKRVLEFLEEAKTFHIATVDGDQPRVRPFGAIMEYNGKIYICTNNTKDCFKQMIKNPKIEIEATVGGNWVRVCAEAVSDPSREAKAAMLEKYPSLTRMYTADDAIYEVLYLTKGVATFYSFGGEPETIEF